MVFGCVLKYVFNYLAKTEMKFYVGYMLQASLKHSLKIMLSHFHSHIYTYTTHKKHYTK
jgi:hypothetical protein